MPIIILDTETTGLMTFASNRKPINPKYYEFYDSCRICELGYSIYSKINGKWKVIKDVSMLVKPDGYKIENSHIHGIEHETAVKEGKDINYVLSEFLKDLKTVNKIVAYNSDFDYNVILSEAYRSQNNELIEKLKEKDIICAMKLAKDKLKLKHIKLIDLYNKLFDTFDIQEHRALADVRMTAKCLFKLI
jgi:DNA polymerase-3 subunit alpha